MEFFENLVLMKRLLRQGWVRAGVPQGSIESLADHSWSVTALTYIFVQLENDLRDSKILDMEKALLIALFHDFPESEYFDIDKSIYNIIDKNKLAELLQELKEGAIQQLVKKTPQNLRDSFEKILTDHKSEEYHIARIADLFDIINQTRDYENKKWLDETQSEAFRAYAIQQLKQYENRFAFIKSFLAELE